MTNETLTVREQCDGRRKIVGKNQVKN